MTDAAVPSMCSIDGTGPQGFVMGSNCGRRDERPPHRVVLRSFAIAIHPTTNRQYACFLTATNRPPPPHWQTPPFDHPMAPVCAVNWHDARAYADWLSSATGIPFHLPTEAQREFAARGSAEPRLYPWGDAEPPLTGPYQRGLDGLEVGKPMPVCIRTGPPLAGPNPLGLWHMGDNVHEWCADFYATDYYARSPTHEPPGPEASDRRAARGGSWRHDIKYCRCTARSSLAPEKHFADFGFRVAASEGFAYRQ